MIKLEAPYPAIVTTSFLPNPQLSNAESLTATLTMKRATDGTLRTYVKTKNGRRKMLWNFVLDRGKALELRAFVLSYHSSQLRVTDHEDRVWLGYIMNNPVEFDGAARGRVAVTLEFEGIEQV